MGREESIIIITSIIIINIHVACTSTINNRSIFSDSLWHYLNPTTQAPWEKIQRLSMHHGNLLVRIFDVLQVYDCQVLPINSHSALYNHPKPTKTQLHSVAQYKEMHHPDEHQLHHLIQEFFMN